MLQWFTYHLYRTVEQLHAERLEGGDKVKGEGVSLLPEAYQQANSDSSQYRRLSDHLINRRPVPIDAAVALRTRVSCCGDADVCHQKFAFDCTL